MSEFSDRPFAVGSLFGIRSFRVTSEGVLTGVVRQLPWRDGINEAECSRPLDALAAMVAAMGGAAASMAQFGWAMEHLTAQMAGTVLLKKRPRMLPKPPSQPASRPKHDAGTLQCPCGFYAYFDRGYNPHHLPGNLLAIVEGFGITTVGSRGFRSSKSRIRALIVENFEQGFALAKVQPRYPGIPVFGSVDAALAAFPLSPNPKGTSLAPDLTTTASSVTVRFVVKDNASDAFRRMVERMRIPTGRLGIKIVPADDETPQERALRLRRERNTGPADPRGLDGHHRRTR